MADARVRSRVKEALGFLLEPVVLVLLKCGVTWKEFSTIAKRKFVEVATKEFGIRGRPTNVSRVAILTGLDRREVRKLRAVASEPDSAQPGFMSKPTQVLEGWYRDPEFADRSGSPRDLALEGERGSLAALVRRYAPGIPVVAMVKELRSVGALEEVKGGKLRALKRTYIPRELSENQIRLWGSVLHDVGTTLETNVSGAATNEPRFERRALNLSVDRAALPEFRAFLEAEGQAFLERVDGWLSAHQVPTSRESQRESIRLGVGVYHIQDADRGARRLR
jgi:hypothetical protein